VESCRESVVDTSSSAAADLPCLPREDAVLLAGDDDRDVMGPTGFQSYMRHIHGEAILDGVRSLGYVSFCMPRKPVNEYRTASRFLLVVCQPHTQRSRNVLLHFLIDLLLDDLCYRRRDRTHSRA